MCTMNSAENLCGDHAKLFYMCKRERDAQLFEAVKNWEKEEFNKLAMGKERKDYIEKLKFEGIRLDKELQEIPLAIGNKHKRWRLEADSK